MISKKKKNSKNILSWPRPPRCSHAHFCGDMHYFWPKSHDFSFCSLTLAILGGPWLVLWTGLWLKQCEGLSHEKSLVSVYISHNQAISLCLNLTPNTLWVLWLTHHFVICKRDKYVCMAKIECFGKKIVFRNHSYRLRSSLVFTTYSLTTHYTPPIHLHVLWPIGLSRPAFLK